MIEQFRLADKRAMRAYGKRRDGTYSSRNSRGNMIVLTLAVVLGILLLVGFFVLKFARMLGSNQEQRTAIEAAALAAAEDMSRAVIKDNNFGYIGLSDAPPIGKAVVAADGFSVNVKSINTIFATIRLDMVIANQINDPTIMQLAIHDYGLAVQAANDLTADLQNMAGGGTGTDMNGAPLNPKQDAIAAYQQNVIRMEGNPNSLVLPTVKLTLGGATGLPSNVQLPSPTSVANVSAASQMNGFYSAFVNVPFNGKDFVFYAASQQALIVDHATFMATFPSPTVPSVVKIDADQYFLDKQMAYQPGSHTVHAVACALCPCTIDPNPNPGGLLVSFPDGKISELASPQNIRNDPELSITAMATRTSTTSKDYPSGPTYGADPIGNVVSPPVLGATGSVAQHFSKLMYDWLRNAGPNVDVQAVVNLQNDSLQSPASPDVGYMVLYTFAPSGMYKTVQRSMLLADREYGQLSDSQVGAVSINEFSAPSTAYTWDASVIDEVAQPGTTLGGRHAGQPVVDPRLPKNPPYTMNNPTISSGSTEPSTAGFFNLPQNEVPNYCWQGRWGGWGYSFFKIKMVPSLTNPITGQPVTDPAGGCNIPPVGVEQPIAASTGAVRPTYTYNGLCGEISFHRVQNSTSYQVGQVNQTGY